MIGNSPMRARRVSPVPWKETVAVAERSRFVEEAARGRLRVSDLCDLYGIRPKTGYKWIKRAREGLGLEDRSHAPHNCPHALSAEVAGAILDVRAAHPTWGPRKLLEKLRKDGSPLP